MEKKKNKREVLGSVALMVSLAFAIITIVIATNVFYAGNVLNRGTSAELLAGEQAEEIVEISDGYVYTIENEKTEAKVTVHHYIDGTTDKVPAYSGGEVDDEELLGYVDDSYSTSPSSNVQRNYSFASVTTTDTETDDAVGPTVDNVTGEVTGIMKPETIEVTYYYTVNTPKVGPDNEDEESSNPGEDEDHQKALTKVAYVGANNTITKEDEEITYNINYTTTISDYVGVAEVTIVDYLPYEVDSSYQSKVTVNGTDVNCTPVYDASNKTLTWVVDVDIDTYGDDFESETVTLNIAINLVVTYKDVNYGVDSITNNAEATLMLLDYDSENPIEPDPDYPDDNEDENEITVNITETLEGTKTWIDNENSYNTRPDTITINVMQRVEGETEDKATIYTSKEIEVTDGSKTYEFSFNNLPKYNEEGNIYIYTVTEEEVTGYDTLIDGNNITNKISQTEPLEDNDDESKDDDDPTIIHGSKSWHTDENVDSLETTIVLLRDGKTYKEETVTGNGTYRFTNLPIYAVGDAVNTSEGEVEDGHKYEYTVVEPTVPGYETTTEDNLNFVNTVKEEGSFTVTKTWVDGDNTYLTRPENVYVTLCATSQGDTPVKTEYTATLNDTNSWTYTFEDIELYDDEGHAITYSVVEDDVEGYEVEYEPITGGMNIINTISQETLGEGGVPAIEGIKTWVEPEGTKHDAATFEIYRNGVKLDGVTATESNGSYSFTGLDKYDLSTGLEWNYEVKEIPVDGYTTTVDESGLNFTNTIDQDYLSLTINKTWLTPNENLSELEAEFTLLRDGTQVETVTLAGTQSNYTFSNLPKYDLTTGKAYSYTVEEKEVEGYTATKEDDLSFVNTIEQDTTKEVTVSKTWVTPEDKSNLYSTIKLYKDGAYVGEAILRGDASYTFKNLDRYNLETGKECVYTAVEEIVSGYSSTTDDNLNFVNTIDQEILSISGEKTWLSPTDPDDLSATIILKKDGTEIDRKTVTGNSKYTFSGLERYNLDEGTEYTYTVEEVEVPGYTTKQSGNDFINTIEQDTTKEITISKTWETTEDVNSLTASFKLYRGNEEVATAQINGNGTYTFTGLDTYDLTTGKEYTYTVTEDAIDNYSTSVDATGLNFTNTIMQEYFDIEGTKTWILPEGMGDQTATFELYRDGVKVATTSVTGDGSFTFNKCEKYNLSTGTEYTYEVKEVKLQGFTSSSEDGLNFVNTIEQDSSVVVEGTKTWVSPTDPDDLTATIELLQDGTVIQNTTVTGNNNYSFTGLDKYNLSTGKEYVYTVQEVEVPGYKLEQSGFNFVNTIEQQKTSVSGMKLWHTDDDKEALQATFYLYKDDEVVPCAVTTVTGENMYKFEDLDKYDLTDGHEISYRVEEGQVPGYITTSNEDGVFTNTHVETKDIEVTKTWVDDDNSYNKRPGSIEVVLTANGVKTEYTEVLAEANNWTTTFEGIDAYDDEGHAIVYSVEENYIEGYDVQVVGTANGFNVINTISQEKTSIKGQKTWVTTEDVKDLSTTIYLLRDGVVVESEEITGNGTYGFYDLDKYDLTDGHEYNYTVDEENVDGYTKTIDGLNIVNTISQEKTSVVGMKSWVTPLDSASSLSTTIRLYRDDEEIASQVVTGNDIYEFYDLDKYDLTDGHEYNYTVEEDEVKGYTTTRTEHGFVNTITEEEVELTGTKTWITPENKDNLEATIILLRDGQEIDTCVVKGDGEYSFAGLDRYNLNNGHEYNYTVEEKAVSGYTTIKDENGNFTNVINQEKTSLTATKTWISYEDTKSFVSSFELLRDGDVIDTFEITGNGSYTYGDLDKYDLTDGHEYSYEVKEATVNGYETSQNGYNFVNSIPQEHVSVYGYKSWNVPDDESNYEATIILLRDGDEIDSTKVKGNSAYEFSELPKYDTEDGHIYNYTVEEEELDGFTVSRSGNNFINTISQEEVEITGSKTWVTPVDQDLLISTIMLYRNGIYYDEVNVIGNDTYSFTGLDKYDANGNEYNYQVAEKEVEGYTSSQSGFDFVNTISQEETEVTVSKEWITPSDPNSLKTTIELYRDDKLVASEELTGNSSYTFKGLDKYDITDGHEYTYTTKEVNVDGYTVDANENSYINTINQEKVTITGTKIWETEDKKSDLEATINLYRDDESLPIDSVVVTGDGSYTFKDLDKYDLTDGHEYSYHVEEDYVPGYNTTEKDGNFINTKVGTVDLNVTKTWVDNSNAYGLRPNIVEISLYANDVSTGKTINLSDSNSWTGTFEGLDAYDEDGKAINYTIKESDVTGYTGEIVGTSDGYKVVNTISQEELTITGNKTWITPEDYGSFEATIYLMQDGVVFDTEVVKGDASYTFYNLDKYDPTDGHEYKYTIYEEPVEGYTVTVDGYNVINTINQEYKSIVGTKTWITPENYSTFTSTIDLLRDGTVIDTKVLTGNDVYLFENLPLYDLEDGHEYKYTVEEEKVDGYTSIQDGYNFTNVIEQSYTEIIGNKSWVSDEDVDQLTTTINLMQDGVVIDSVDITGNDVYEFKDLEKYDLEDGHIYTYDVEEVEVEGYNVQKSGNNFKNVIEQETVTINGSKTWISPEDESSLITTIDLMQDGVVIDSRTLVGNTEFSFTNLDKYDLSNGHKYNYTLSEVSVPGYTTEKDGYDFTNVIEQEKISISGTKTWITPVEDKETLVAQLTLYRDGEEVKTITVEGDDDYSFTGLDKYDLTDGHIYNYTVEEKAYKGYTTSQDGYNFVNTINQDETSLTVSKTWISPDDASNHTAEINLLRDGVIVDYVKLTGNDSYTFSGLDKYDLTDGHIYNYTSSEEEVRGYTTESDGNDYVNTVEQVYFDITGEKTWVDQDNKYLTRPDDITINLIRDDEEYKSVTITEKDGWEYSFNDLETYDLTDGHIYSYEITENEVNNYLTEINGYNIKNTYVGSDDIEIEEELHKIAETEVITNEDQEVDYDIEYDFTINNYAGKAVVTIVDHLPAEIDVSASDLDGGTYAITKDADGNLEYTITWEEEIEVLATGYTGHIEEHVALHYVNEDVTEDLINEADVTITTFYAATHPLYPNEPREEVYEDEDEADVEQVYKVEVPVVKVWDDSDNAKGHRPESVTLSLTADGNKAKDYDGKDVEDVILTEKDNWEVTFTNLPKYDDEGHEINYEVVETETRNGDLEYYNDPEVVYGEDYVEVRNSYQMKETELESSISKESQDEMTSTLSKVTYNINYSTTVTEYIGDATLIVTDTLPFGIDRDNSNLSDGQYNENTHEITWEVDLGHINTDKNGDFDVSFSKEITVVYGDNLELPLTEITNEVEGKIYLTENEMINTVSDETVTKVEIPGTVIVKYIDIETGEEIADEVVIEGYAGEEYVTDLIQIPYYDFVEATDNIEGKIVEGTTEVIYYYELSMGDVIVRHFDIETGEEIAESDILTGIIGTDYEAEPKVPEYYVLVESTDNVSGTFEKDPIEVDFYYRKAVFNFDINKTISNVTKDGSSKDKNSTTEKVEVGRNDANSTTISVTYKITVVNTGEVEGTATVVDYLPDYFVVSKSNPSYWINRGNELELEVTLDAGEAVDLYVTLDWVGGDESFGSTTNTAMLLDLTNPAKYDEESTADNISQAKVLLSVRTGWDNVKDISPFVVLIACAAALIIIKVRSKRNDITTSDSNDNNNDDTDTKNV